MRRVACSRGSHSAALVVVGSLGWLYAVRTTHVALKINLDPTAVRPRSSCLSKPVP